MRKRNIKDPKSWFAVLQTGEGAQTAVMTLKPGQSSGSKGNEHPKSEQVLLVVAGDVVAEIGTVRAALTQGDVVIVPRGVAHRFSNESSERAVTFTCIRRRRTSQE